MRNLDPLDVLPAFNDLRSTCPCYLHVQLIKIPFDFGKKTWRARGPSRNDSCGWHAYEGDITLLHEPCGNIAQKAFVATSTLYSYCGMRVKKETLPASPPTPSPPAKADASLRSSSSDGQICTHALKMCSRRKLNLHGLERSVCLRDRAQ